MRKSDILETLRAVPYDPKAYWVVTGGAMVLHGFREQTHDIDLGCTKQLADQLEAAGFLYKVMEDGNRWFKLSKDVEAFENWLYDAVVSVEGVPVISIPGLLAMKQALGREKDLRDVRLIREAFPSQTRTSNACPYGVTFSCCAARRGCAAPIDQSLEVQDCEQ